MVQLDAISMDMLRMSSHRVVDTLAHSQSSTAMSKSCSGISLASSQATQRTKCSSGFSSIGGGSTRCGANSSAPHTPGPLERGSMTYAENNSASSVLDEQQLTPPPEQHQQPQHHQQPNEKQATEENKVFPAAPPKAARGGGKTVLGGVAPTMQGMLRRRARFSGWRTEMAYFEVRSTALVSFALHGKVESGGGGHASAGVSLASIAQRIMHPTMHQKAGQPGDWTWSADIAGAERVLELPALSKRGMYALGVEFGAGKRKTIVLAASSAADRERWINALDGARHRVWPEDFKAVSVIGEGHFGKVLLVRWNKRRNTSTTAPSSISNSSTTSRRSRATSGLPARVAEEGGASGTDKGVEIGPGSSNHGIKSPSAAVGRNLSSDSIEGDEVKYLAVKEVALTKTTSLPGVLNERQILGVLKEHPFVVTLQCAWRSGNFLYYGLDFLPGADLFELFRRQYIKMDMASARVYGGQVALALQHLHAHGICYRDLKPENILVDANGHLRLADMGLSKILGVGDDSVRTSTVCGTRAYLAPEMVLRKPYGFSVDYWQFGCFLFELYAGHSPFWTPRSGPPGRANDQTVALILAGEISYPRSMEPIAKSFIRDLLHPDAGLRLGCGSRTSPNTPPSSRSKTVTTTTTTTPIVPAVPTEKDSAQDSVAPMARNSSAVAVTGDDSRSVGSGCGLGGGSGWDKVRAHEFFGGMDWKALLRREVPAPLKPGCFGKGKVGNFSREYTRQRVQWGSEQQELRDMTEKEGLFKRELLGFDFVRHP